LSFGGTSPDTEQRQVLRFALNDQSILIKTIGKRMARFSFIVALFTLAVALGRVTSFTASTGE
jgi:hypothetical protein